MATATSEARKARFNALIDYEDAYVQPLILSALQSRLDPTDYNLSKSLSDCPNDVPLLQICAYEGLDFERSNSLVNAYVIRKALIRKHYLSNTVSTWLVKNPESVLKKNVKPAIDFELDYAEFLDDALVEAFELHDSFEKNASKPANQRDWWILKPGMSDRGQGIRLFSTEDELQSIFEEWEEGVESEPDDEDVPSDVDDLRKPLSRRQSRASSSGHSEAKPKDYIVTSQLRHFIAQPYIHPPLLLSPQPGAEHGGSSKPRKFHIRTYVLSVGALKVYVYKPMLALFAANPYVPPWMSTDPEDLKAHLTNTCLQDSGDREGSVLSYWSLPDTLDHASASSPSSTTLAEKKDWKNHVFQQICATTGELFQAAARGQTIHFQTHPNAFELFGLDFLVDGDLTAYLLEVNAFPDFRQTGDDLKDVVQGLMEDVFDVAVKPYFHLGDQGKAGTERLKLVLDIDLGRG